MCSSDLYVIIRPRGGDFLYSPIEQRIMLKDIDNARRLEADGIVLGCLTPDGEVDIPLMKQLMEAAQGMSVLSTELSMSAAIPKKHWKKSSVSDATVS